MTVVCCWFDESYGLNRIAALADTRATSCDTDGLVTVHNETTMKLFRIRISCHSLAGLDLRTGAWTDPYYSTEIGIGFSGYCFEGLTIIALASRCLEHLVASEGPAKPIPNALGITNVLKEVVSRFFETHTSPSSQWVDFLVFGFHSEIESKPWLYQISHRPKSGVTSCLLPLTETDFHVVGSIQTEGPYKSAITDLRSRIDSHKKRLKLRPTADNPGFELDLETARHEVAGKKAIEHETLLWMENEFAVSVGGQLQKMELYEECGSGVATFTNHAGGSIFNALPLVALPGLGFVPIVERMGR